MSMAEMNSSGNGTLRPLYEAPFSLPMTVILGILASLLSICTVGGNILVLVAFFVERNIRTASNYFIASLAVTDLMIGLISMNFYTAYLLLGYWPMSQLFCDLWLWLDYTACLTSQYTVFFITVDRFCSVKIPAKYRAWRSDNKVSVMVAVTWILPSTIFFMTIIGWPLFQDRERPNDTCYAEFSKSAIFNTILTIGYFWITLIVMFVLYTGIYRVAWRLQKKSDDKHQRMAGLMAMAAGNTMSRMAMGVGFIQNDSVSLTEKSNQNCKPKHSRAKPLHQHITHQMDSTDTTPNTSFKRVVEEPEQQPLTNQEPKQRPPKAPLLTVTITTNPLPTIESSYDDYASKESSTSLKSPSNKRYLLNAPPDRLVKLRFIDDENVSSDSIKSLSFEADPLCDILPASPSSEYFPKQARIEKCPPDVLELSNTTTNHIEMQNLSPPSVARSRSSHGGSFFSKLKKGSTRSTTSTINGLPNSSPDASGHSYLKIPLRDVAKKLTNLKRSDRRKSDNAKRNENRARKALRTISLILGAFVACWTPFHVLILIKGFCDKEDWSCVNTHLYNTAYWLCYMNSPINPFCYALANAQFKTTFVRVLSGNLHRV